MGAYNIVNRAAMQAGQSEDISVVVANLDAVAAVLNGGVDNTNIAPAAAIAYSKLLLTNGIVNADIAAGAAIDQTKLNVPLMGRNFGWAVGSTPPASPSNGDIWVYSGNGVYWMFLYVAAEATNKWVFIGGPPIVVNYQGPATSGSGSYVDLPPTITLPRAGDYEVDYSAFQDTTGGNGQPFLGLVVGGTFCWELVQSAVSIRWQPRYIFVRTGAAASDVVKLQHHTNGGSPSISTSNISIAVKPIKVI